MSNNRALAEQLPVLTSPQETPSPARPKVMRRPAQFTDMRPKSIAPSIVMPTPGTLQENENLARNTPQPAEPSLTQKPWQDDVRFGIAMLTIVVLVNLALMVWLPHMRPVPGVPAEQKQEAENSGAVTTPPDHALTFYTKPGTEPIAPVPLHPQPEVRVLGATDSGPNQ